MQGLLESIGLVAAGGAVGALARYGTVVLLHGRAPAWVSIMLVNVVGCGLVGVAAAMISADDRLFVLVGVLGGLTTFSTSMIDVWVLWRSKRIVQAFVVLFGTPLFSMAAVVGGFGVGGVL